jgi:ornithine cyclodeaminase
MSAIPFFSAEEVHAALPWEPLVNALAKAFARGAQVPLRHVHAIHERENARLLLMPAWRPGEVAGVKLVTVFPGNAARGLPTVGALYVLLDGATGRPRAILDGEALTLRRTAAASALASRHLSRPASETLLLVGAGALAPWMAHAHCSVRPIRRLLLWARRPQAAQSLAIALRESGLPAEAAPSLSAALAHADIVTCATTAREPVLRSEWIRAGTHIDLVGGFTRDMREADDDLVARASVFVDTHAGALAEAGDLVQPIERGRVAKDHVRAELATLVRGEDSGRRAADEVTLFKSVGTALEDLCAAELVVERVGKAR